MIWVFRFGVRDCTTSSSGQVTCRDLELGIKIILTIVSALGCWILLCSYPKIYRVFRESLTYSSLVDMPKVLRLVYSRFAVQEMLADKMEDLEEQAPPPLPVEHEYVQVEPEMDAEEHTDELMNKPAVDV